MMKSLKRFILKYRIDSLRGDIALGYERKDLAQRTVDSMDRWLIEAHCKLRALRSRLALIERPEVLLKEAIRE